MGILTDAVPCGFFKSPPYIGLPTPASKACEAAKHKVVDPALGAVNDAAVPDEHVTLSRLAIDAGFVQGHPTKEGDPNEVAVLLGVINAESGGDTNVRNPQPCSNKGDHAVGLTQICTPMHMSEADAKDPRKNLAKARELYVACGNSFSCDWPTYHKGITGPDKTIVAGKHTATDTVTGAADKALNATGLGAVSDLIKALFNPDTYFRLGKGTLGGIVIIIGIAGVMAVVLKPVAQMAAGVASPIGKINRAGRIASKVGRPSA